jgi:hypothetical protein
MAVKEQNNALLFPRQIICSHVQINKVDYLKVVGPGFEAVS